MARKKSKKRAKRAKKAATSRKDSAEATMVTHGDNYVNAVTGIGQIATDKRQSTRFKASSVVTDPELTNLYRFSGLMKRVINLPASDMTRNGFKVNGDDKDVIPQKFEALGAQSAYKDALIWAGVYGGSVILMGIDDGRGMAEPVNINRISDVMYLQVFDRTMVQVDQATISNDPTSPHYGKARQYLIQPVTGGTPFTVHASRVIRFDGAKLPPSMVYRNKGWHDSIIQAIYEQMRQIGAVYDSSEFIVDDFIQAVLKIDNLQDMLLPSNAKLLKARLNALDMSKHVANTTLLGDGESYEKHASSVAGLAELLDRFMMAVSSVRGIPVTLLFGRSPAGQNATGDADIRLWYDAVHSEQTVELQPRLDPLIRYCFAAAGGEPETWSVEFNPLWTMTSKEWAEVYELNAKGDDIGIANGSLDPAAVARYRFGGESYNATPPTFEPDELDEQENAAKLAEEEKVRMAEAAKAAEAAAKAELGEE